MLSKNWLRARTHGVPFCIVLYKTELGWCQTFDIIFYCVVEKNWWKKLCHLVQWI